LASGLRASADADGAQRGARGDDADDLAVVGAAQARDGAEEAARLLGLALAVSLLTLVLPQLTQSEAKLGILVLFPVLLAGLMRGVLLGYLVAALVCAIQILAGRLLGLPVEGVLDLQLVLAMSAATALLAGAAHDDKHFEWQHANFDLLTGLANRHRLEERLSVLTRTDETYTLILFDLDHFKRVNDMHGHAMGDLVLRGVAEITRRHLPEGSLAARWGGEEFLLILPEQRDKHLHATYDRLRADLPDGDKQFRP